MTEIKLIGKLSTSDSTYDSTGIDLGTFAWEYDHAEQTSSFGLIGPAREQEHESSMGAERTIIINGQYGPTGATWAQVYAWMEAMDALITGSQYDDSAHRYLCLYHKNLYSTGVHLWGLRDDPSLAQSSSGNKPMHVIVESFAPKIGTGTSPEVSYTLRVKQQVKFA